MAIQSDMNKIPTNIHRMILAAFLGGVTMWLLAGLWHEIIMASFYRNEVHAVHEGRGIIFTAFMVLGFFMAYLYPRFSRGKYTFKEGLLFGVVIGILWVFPHELVGVGAHGGSIAYVLKNAAWHMVEQGIGGIVIGHVYNHGTRRVSARVPNHTTG